MFCCKDTTELASDYLEDGLHGSLGWRFRLHLLICRNCRHYIGQLRRTVAMVGALPARSEAPPPSLEDALIGAFRTINHRS
mgnify:CR=1 FL=1